VFIQACQWNDHNFESIFQRGQVEVFDLICSKCADLRTGARDTLGACSNITVDRVILKEQVKEMEKPDIMRVLQACNCAKNRRNNEFTRLNMAKEALIKAIERQFPMQVQHTRAHVLDTYEDKRIDSYLT
jgi:hypothetical protein